MPRQPRTELENEVQRLEREDPKRSAAEIEHELATRAPVAYGAWVATTPVLRSRLRAVQRWRRGARGRGYGVSPQRQFPYLWPVGERQRKEAEPTFAISPVVASGSWRLYLYNCSPEVVRDVRISLDGAEIDYAPAIGVGRFAEIHWQRVDEIRGFALSGGGERTSRHALRAGFVIARGTREGLVDGELTLDASQGWVFFVARDGRRRELE